MLWQSTGSIEFTMLCMLCTLCHRLLWDRLHHAEAAALKLLKGWLDGARSGEELVGLPAGRILQLPLYCCHWAAAASSCRPAH
jgi:hypothetical protein